MDIEKPNCIGCHHIHPDNGNCTAVGGFCTAVPAAHCPLIPELRDELEQVKRERHGRWFFKYPNGWACSRCGEWGLMIDNRGIYKSSYCPNCGARMDKEDEHEAG
jgi:hypothetical protein